MCIALGRYYAVVYKHYNQHAMQQQWEVCYTTNTDINARLIAGHLQAQGIPAQVLSQVDTMRAFTVGDLAIAKVLVPQEYYTQAIECLIDMEIEDESDNTDTDTFDV